MLLLPCSLLDYASRYLGEQDSRLGQRRVLLTRREIRAKQKSAFAMHRFGLLSKGPRVLHVNHGGLLFISCFIILRRVLSSTLRRRRRKSIRYPITVIRHLLPKDPQPMCIYNWEGQLHNLPRIDTHKQSETNIQTSRKRLQSPN